MYIIAGQFGRRKLLSPKGSETRPTTGQLREAVFNICQSYVEGANFLDLFAGSGAMGFEAISRGARSATFIDSSKEALKCLKSNAESLDVLNISQIYSGDVFYYLNLLKNQKKQFEIIYADPPYNKTEVEKLIHFIDSSSLLSSEGILFIEEALEAAPELSDLKVLKLKNSRRYGRSVLQQYVYQ